MVSMFIICNAFEVSGVFYCFICVAKKKKKLPNSANFSLAKKGKGKLEKKFLKFISNQNSLPLLGLDPFKINF